MEKQYYGHFNQTIYHEQLANGLSVQLMPMAGFNKTYAILTTDFGAIDNRFIPQGSTEPITLPAGVAHFLEHKMFEKADHDAFDLFGRWGADANAFTGYTRTSYLFSTSSYLKENLGILLDFVFDPYFTDKTVEKEKGIIGQEIRMYDDDPDWQLYMGMLANLYPHDPMRLDIAGTVDSIRQITPDDLWAAYNTFYQPSNMNLFIVGRLEPERTLEWVKEDLAKKNLQLTPEPHSLFKLNDPTGGDVKSFSQTKLPVSRPKMAIGIRGLEHFKTGHERLRYKLTVDLLLDVLFDDTSDNFLRLYNAGILDDSFSYSLDMQRGFYFAGVASDTDQQQKFADEMMEILNSADSQIEAGRSRFTAIKRAELGRLIGLLDSPEEVANRYAGRLFGGANLLDEISVLRSITIDDLADCAHSLVKPQAMTVFEINKR